MDFPLFLNSLLGFGGANNGRLGDTTFLTQFKIVENSDILPGKICNTPKIFYHFQKKSHTLYLYLLKHTFCENLNRFDAITDF